MTENGRQEAPRLSSDDLEQLEALGISGDEAERQLALLSGRRPMARLDRPCVVGDGVRALSDERTEALAAKGDAAAAHGRLSKFVPASGAASRMFQSLLEPGVGSDARGELVANLERFPFGEDLRAAAAAAGSDLDDLIAGGEYEVASRYLLATPGLGYAALAKGLLKFHDYPVGARTAFEEHLVEAHGCVRDRDGLCRLHFTVSVEHQGLFEELLEQLQGPLLERYGTRFEVGFSNQSPATDTLAVDLDNQPFRLGDGDLLLRPGGHGALIRNLGALCGDVVLIKNIDNVVPDAGKELVCRWKRVLSGYLVELQERAFELRSALDRDAPSGDVVREGLEFLAEELEAPSAPALASAGVGAQLSYLRSRLDRPIRVCGVVRVEGEPGGGPFWVRGPEGEATPQIVEQSQIDREDEGQRSILASSTHFNPVDLVCGMRDHRGEAYDLDRFIDHRAVFVARKSLDGGELKALERPGLWNGAMAGWNTVFVEVPAATFAPVKTVFDLLRPAHQPPASAAT